MLDHECIDVDPQIPTGICAICSNVAEHDSASEPAE